ncbi:MAG TPA: tetratricopeptide repeat protein, partial [Gemmatimonadales bacterium]|nr:tetratricopeptide repeat protein [Gemmatimonadales bacterium]
GRIVADADGQEIRINADSAFCGNCAGYDLGWAYDRAGERDSVVAVLERVVNATPEWEQFYDDAIHQAHAYQRLGELYEERGDRARALDYYGRLLDQWRNADPALAPLIREIRGRVARLAGEGTR